ncbi:MAG: hypothetical protein ACI4TD_14190 [Phocaeicola sp.]
MNSKIIFLALCCLLVSSCETVNIPQVTVTVLRDYTPMTDKGIFVTESNSVDFDYVPLGSVVSVTNGAYRSSLEKGSMYENVDLGKAFEEISNMLVVMGANGLINLKIESSFDDLIHYMTVTGMAIRTKEPLLKTKEIIEHKQPSECTIDGITARIIRKTKTGVIVSTTGKFNYDQVIKMIDELNLPDTAIKIYQAGEARKAYAGITDDGYYINYDTNEFIKLTKDNM